jgi:hypothetical protein
MKNIREKSKNKRNTQRGVAIIMALLCVVLLSMLAAALVFVTNTETISSNNYRQLAQSRYVAEAGAQTAVDWLANNIPAPNPAAYDLTQYPLALSGQNCKSGNTSGCVMLSTNSSQATFPDPGNTLQSGFANYFNSSTNGTVLNGISPKGTPNNVVSAQLMSLKPATAFGSSTPQYLQSWKIISAGSFSNFQNAQSQVRLEVETFLTPFPQFAAFANSSNCNAIGLTGNAKTDSYDSSQSGTFPQGITNTNGNVGTNGSASLSGNAAVNGTDSWANKAGNCSAPSGGNPGTVQKISPVTLPPAPAIPPSVTANSTPFSCCTLTPNTGYEGVSLSGNDTLALGPGTYYMDSLSISGKGQITISPAGSQVIIYITGTGSSGGFSISGNGISDVGTGDMPAHFQLIYNGTASSSITGNGTTQAVVYAPNSNISVTGNGDIGGAIVANTVNFTGNGVVHYDRNLGNNFGFLTTYITTAFSWDNAD